MTNMYSFRNRVIISDPLEAPDNAYRYLVPSDTDSEVVELLGPQGEDPIAHAMELRLRGSGYTTRDKAIDAGKLWRDRLTVAFAHYEKGIEIGPDGRPDEPKWSGGQPYFIYELGRIMRDSPKLTIFPTNQEPSWSGAHLEGVVAHPVQTFINGPLAWVTQRGCRLSEQQSLPYNLFHATYFESSPEARYILLFTAIEALIPKRKDDDSIRNRGRKWVQRLGGDTFDGMTPEDYFLRAYATRNNLAHGNVSRPDSESLRAQIPELRRYLLVLLDIYVFGESMPGLMGFNPDGSIRPEAAS